MPAKPIELSRVFNVGWDAYENWQELADNPYQLNTWAHAEWTDGWKTGKGIK